jgi:hypothetical protein
MTFNVAVAFVDGLSRQLHHLSGGILNEAG